MKEVLTEVRTEKIGNITLHNMDNMEFMRTVPDKYFDLAIVDPPYGIGEGNKRNKTRSSFTGFGGNKKWVQAKDYGGGEFDHAIPPPEYFDELFRISKNQIIWGGNYMVEYLKPSMGWIVWDKDNGDCDQSDCELAYTSFKKGLRQFTFRWHGLLQKDMKNKEQRIHPTQKPVALYKWILNHYTTELKHPLQPKDKILDTHLGSGSIAIACHDYKFELVGMEIDKDYFNAAVKRLKQHVSQTSLFDSGAYPLVHDQPLNGKGDTIAKGYQDDSLFQSDALI